MGKGSYRFRAFRLSDMMPNSWFYKLRDMGSRGFQNSREKGQVPRMETGKSFENQKPIPKPPQKQAYTINRPSYYVPSRSREEKLHYFPTHPKATDTHLPIETPRRIRTKLRKKSLSTDSKLNSYCVSSVCTCQKQRSSVLSLEPAPAIPLPHLDVLFDDELVTTDHNFPIPLPPIVTKPLKKESNKPNHTVRNLSSKQGSFLSHGNIRRSTPGTPRIKMRLNSPRLAKKRLKEKKGLADSLVVVKSSSDPQRDFRESMLEMIFQNNLQASKDLEELLCCYLSLNSDEYHDLIVKVFKEIWFDLTVINLH